MPTATPHASGERRTDIDAVRLFAVVLQFPFHVARAYDRDPVYSVKNNELSAGFDVLTGFLHSFRMPLFFLVAGWATLAMLSRRDDGPFIAARAKRLLVPFIVGFLAFCPWIKAIEYAQTIDLNFRGLHRWWNGVPGVIQLYAVSSLNPVRASWSHLWFLFYLFLITVAFVAARRILPRPRLPPTALVWGPLALVMMIEATLRPVFGDYPNLITDWANIAVFVVFFVLGARLFDDAPFAAAFDRAGPALAVIGVAAAIALAVMPQAAAWGARGAAAWGISAGLSWLFRRCAPARRSWWFDEAVRASLAIYVLHHLPCVALNFWVREWAWPPIAKFAFVTVLAGAVTIAAYVVFVRPFAITRFAFGVTPPSGSAPPARAPSG